MKCSLWDKCNAPLCPLDRKSLKYGLWYTDEDICSKRAYQNKPWIQNQRYLKNKKVEGYFTYEMLKIPLTDKDDIWGIDPNISQKSQLKKWMKQFSQRPKKH